MLPFHARGDLCYQLLAFHFLARRQYYFVVGNAPEVEPYDKDHGGERTLLVRSLYRVIVVADWIVSARDLVRHHGEDGFGPKPSHLHRGGGLWRRSFRSSHVLL